MESKLIRLIVEPECSNDGGATAVLEYKGDETGQKEVVFKIRDCDGCQMSATRQQLKANRFEITTETNYNNRDSCIALQVRGSQPQG